MLFEVAARFDPTLANYLLHNADRLVKSANFNIYAHLNSVPDVVGYMNTIQSFMSPQQFMAIVNARQQAMAALEAQRLYERMLMNMWSSQRFREIQLNRAMRAAGFPQHVIADVLANGWSPPASASDLPPGLGSVFDVLTDNPFTGGTGLPVLNYPALPTLA